MVKIVLVKKTGELQDSVVKNHDLEHLAKKCGYRKVDNFKMHVNWAVTIEESYYNIELYAKDTGKATFENKYDFPPPIDTLLLFENTNGENTFIFFMIDNYRNFAKWTYL